MEHEAKRFRCGGCGGEFFLPELTEFEDHLFCLDCLDEETVLCRDCGERIWRDANEGTEDHPLCEDCFDSHYIHCERCGRLLRCRQAYYLDDDDDETPYCDACYEAVREQPIQNYSYKPTPIFYGDGPRYFGVELEIDMGGKDNANAEKILRVGNREDEHIYCKHDGSLDDGLEIVSHPMSLYYHTHNMPWREVVNQARQLGYRSHQADTCGLHVHISRNAFGENGDAQDAAIARVLYFVERNWTELLRFSRRTQQQMDRWAARYGYKDQPWEMLEHVKKGYASRYTCVNLNNYSTIEFRIFRGSLKYNTLIATLQMVDHICDVAVSLSDEELRELSWSCFVAQIQEPELIQYLRERRLYVNDPVESEAEV